MRFRAVIITRKKLITIIAATVATAALGFAEAVSDFKPDVKSETYRAIIADGIGTEGLEKPDFRGMIAKLLGFDVTEPKTIADAYVNDYGDGDTSATDSPSAAENVPPEQETPPEAADNRQEGADIYEDAEEVPFPTKAQIASAGNLAFSNATNYEVDLAALCAEDLNFSIDDGGPQVLIIHTHTTECYSGDAMPGETERTTDTEKSVVAVGDTIAETLENYGISVYHDKTFHDYPSYQGAYTRELSTVTKLMEQYPSIKIILDVHRDAFVYEDGTRLRVVNANSDVPTAQVMLVSGTDSMGLYDPEWRENLKFAAKIQNAAELMYPGLMRPIDLRTERFNLHMTTGSLILEVGSNGNTLAEAKNAGHDVARAIAAVLAK